MFPNCGDVYSYFRFVISGFLVQVQAGKFFNRNLNTIIYNNERNNMEQFNLEEYLKNPNRKLVTRDGKPVRILCTDRLDIGDQHPVIALVKYSAAEEYSFSYSSNGRIYSDEEFPDDLFFATTKHEGWVNVYRNGSNYNNIAPFIYPTEESAKFAATGENYITTIKIQWEE